MMDTTTGNNCKFADDGTLWHTGEDLDKVKDSISRDILEVMKWTEKWRINVNISKCEVCIFSKSKIDEHQKELNAGPNTFKYSHTPKLLGVTLDEQLKFDHHVDQVERKANGALYALREIKGLSKISRRKLVNIYGSLVRSIIEYASPVWQITSNENMKKLERIQRKGLAICLGLPGTASREAMEVEGNVIPIDLRIEQMAIREIAKVQSKDISEPIRQQLERFKNDDGLEQFESPFGKALTQASEMYRETGVNIEFIEPEYTFTPGGKYLTMQKPSYWSRLGSSKSRTQEQQAQCIEVVEEMTKGANDNTIISFTDGSCLGNPGPCGAGAAIYPGSGSVIPLKRPVAKRGSILLGEMVAIMTTLEYCITNFTGQYSKIQILSDSQTAVGIISLNWASTNYMDLIRDIQEGIASLQRTGTETEVMWVPGHANIAGNDIADKLAKEAAEEAKHLDESANCVTKSDVIQAAKQSTLTKWQNRWNISNSGRHLYELMPSVQELCHLDYPNPSIGRIMTELRTGYSHLNYYRHQIGISPSPLCECGGIETTEHYLLHCTIYEPERIQLRNKIAELVGININTVASLLTKEEETKEHYLTITALVADYIKSTNRFQDICNPATNF